VESGEPAAPQQSSPADTVDLQTTEDDTADGTHNEDAENNDAPA